MAAALGAAAPAWAAIPASLHTAANCTKVTPGPGYDVYKCDDGIPDQGGTTPNLTGAKAVTVPAKYGGDGYTGLPAKAADAVTVPGADPTGDVALDVDVTLPTVAPPAGGYPLVVMMHGCCSGNKTSWEANSFDAGGEKWHYSNAWFAARGYAVITYTSRGFVSSIQSGNHGSTGETQLDSRAFEVNDYQSLSCQVYAAAKAGDFDGITGQTVAINPSRVVTTGGSYGGGFAWMSLTDPKWTCTSDTGTTDPMSLVATAPKYGWTDLVGSLVPTGTHSPLPGDLPATDGCDSGPMRLDGDPCTAPADPITPVGIPIKSILSGLYAAGKTGVPPGTAAHATFPSSVDQAFACLNGPYPPETNPLCASTIDDTLPEFLRDRSAYYQNGFFQKIATDASYRVPVFDAATFTDPLFPPVENRRMINRLRAVAAANGFSYPVQAYYGDYQHFTQNKAKIWGDVCGSDRHVCTTADFNGNLNADPAALQRLGVTTRLNRFIDHYAQPPGDTSAPQPNFDVTAELQVCPENATNGQPADESGQQFTAPTFEGIAPNTLDLDFTGSQTTTNRAVPNPHGVNSDPVQNSLAQTNGGKCPTETQQAGPGVASYTSEPLTSTATMVGATKVSISFNATDSTGLELNARLYDVLPDGKAVMVDRGPRRVTPAEAAAGSVTYWLHANGWRFPAGHRVRIEIAQDDSPYLTPSDVPSSTTISEVKLAVPIVEGDQSGGGGPTPLLPGPCANRLDGTKKGERFSGTPKGDRIHARGGGDRVHALAGADCVFGERGRDRLFGQGGRDRLSGGKGRDTLDGGAGKDRIAGGRGRDLIHAQDGRRDVIRCGPGRDVAQVDPRKDKVRGCEIRAFGTP